VVGSTRALPLWVVGFEALGFPLPDQGQFSRVAQAVALASHSLQ